MAEFYIADAALLNRNEDLHAFRRPDKPGKVLLVQPDSAGWIVLAGRALSSWQGLQRPIRAGDWLQQQWSDNPREGKALLQALYVRNMLYLDGKSFYQPSSMWQLPQRYPTFLCLHITEACNFKCKYCYAWADAKKARMSLDTAKLIISKLLRELPVPWMTIDFHGGEPLLAFPEMLEAMKYAMGLARELGKQVEFMSQSNGSLITPDKLTALKEITNTHKFVLGVSIDGPGPIHDVNRIWPDGQGTFTAVWDGIRRAQEAGINPGLLAIVHQPEYYSEVSRFFLEQGFTSFRINYSSYIGRAKDELDFDYKRGELFAHHYLKMVREVYAYAKTRDQHISLSDLNNQIHNLVEKDRPFMCYRSPCGIGNSILGFAIDGGIHGCEENASTGIFRLGSIYDDINLKQLVESGAALQPFYARTVDNIPKCRRCAFRRLHGAGCTSKVFAQYGTIMRESPMCRFYQVVFEELMWMLDEEPDMVKHLIFQHH